MKDITLRKTHELLREQTKCAHKRVENTPAMRLLMNSNLQKDDYFAILHSWLNWIYKNESYIFSQLADYSPADIKERSRIRLLEKDVGNYKNEWAANFASTQAPIYLENKYEAIGAMYVLEGSTLGGQIIVKRIRSRLGQEVEHHFYTGFGTKTHEMWSAFIAHLDACNMDSAQVQLAVKGAIKTFDSLTVCFEQSGFRSDLKIEVT